MTSLSQICCVHLEVDKVNVLGLQSVTRDPLWEQMEIPPQTKSPLSYYFGIFMKHRVDSFRKAI